jgi:hypothetical protein
MCVRDIDYTSVSTIFPLVFGIFLTVYHFFPPFYLIKWVKTLLHTFALEVLVYLISTWHRKKFIHVCYGKQSAIYFPSFMDYICYWEFLDLLHKLIFDNIVRHSDILMFLIDLCCFQFYLHRFYFIYHNTISILDDALGV